mmetsp:Transcript_71387/g.115775  ORF Transcript_71387/g.115775 Transcript_71387/m.115775 type:complete len:113 (-) Transcript_71387:62-400(-)
MQSVARVSLREHARIDKEGEQEQDAEEGKTIGPLTAHGRAYRMVADEQDTATAHQDTPTAFRVPWIPRHVRKRDLPWEPVAAVIKQEDKNKAERQRQVERNDLLERVQIVKI